MIDPQIFPIGLEHSDTALRFECDGKQGTLDFTAEHPLMNPGLKRYNCHIEPGFQAGGDPGALQRFALHFHRR